MDRSKWEYKKLGEVCTLLNGFAFKSNKYIDNGIRIMRITNVQKGEIVDDDPKYYPLSSQSEIIRYMLKENDLLVSLTGNVGRVGLLHRELLPAALNQRVACLRIKDKAIDLRYIFHLMNSDLFESECIANSQGIAQKNMSTKWLENYKLPVPPTADQQRIVAELDCLNEMIALKQEQLKEFDKLAQSIFYDMFGDPMENSRKWIVAKLEDVVSENCSISYGIVQPGDDVENGIPVVRPVDLISSMVYKSGLKVIDKAISDSYKRTILKGNEILFCVRGTTGIMSFASEELKGCNVTRGITPLEFGNSIDKYYAYYLLKTPYLQSIIAEKTNGIALKQINMRDVRLLPIMLPPLGLQQQFAEKITAIEAQKELVKQSIAETQALLDYTMDKYFGYD